jgi:hypothetical protein
VEPEAHNKRQQWRTFAIGSAIVVLLLSGAGYAWTFTPSYSLYQIRRALSEHDYPTFSRYVDVDSIVDHAFEELNLGTGESGPRGFLGKLLKRGLSSAFARETREVVKAGVSIAVEQAVSDRDRPLPQIPAFAVIGALWQGHTEEDTTAFPIKLKKGVRIEVKARQTSEGIWRVVEVANLSALLPLLRSEQSSAQMNDQ